MNLKNLLAHLTVAVGAVLARTVFSEISVNGFSQGHAVGIRVPSTNDPITDIYSTDIICNKDFLQPVSQTVIPVVAGDKVSAQCHRTSAGLSTRVTEPLDPTKKGPVMAYLAAIPDATQTDVTGLKWFKIWEDGYDSTTHQWGSDHLFINGGNATFTIPSCIAPGQYLLRIEYISLLDAKDYPGAQFYLSCAQLNVKASGAAIKVPETVDFPGAYQSNDPGIVTSIVGIYDYFTPGPFPFTC